MSESVDMPFAFDCEKVPTPCWVVDEVAVERNLAVLGRVQDQTGCRVLLALKAFALVPLAPLVGKYLAGTNAASLHEARLGKEFFPGEVHMCAPAYRDDEIDDMLTCADHVVFNSFAQWRRLQARMQASPHRISCGIRVNPGHSEVDTALYDPCGPGSRLGVPLSAFEPDALDGISGLHFHTLCEKDADALERTVEVVERALGDVLHTMQWLNLGGGHHITRSGYDLDRLCRLLNRLQEQYQVQVYLEPGEAVGLHAGVLVGTVLDVMENDGRIAVLDTSATAHMPDVLEMPYRPDIVGAGEPGEYSHDYQLGGMTCQAGDVIGTYSFPVPLESGARVVFCDMAHYTMTKTTTFNGVRLPSIAICNSSTGDLRVVREFGYEDYRSRLG